MEQIESFLKHFLSQNETAILVAEKDQKEKLIIDLQKNNFKKLDFFKEQNINGLYYLELEKNNVSSVYNLFKQVSDGKTLIQLTDTDNNYITKHVGDSGLKLILIANQESLKIADFTDHDFINLAGMVEYLK